MNILSLKNTKLTFSDLFNPQGLSQLDTEFLNYLKKNDPDLYYHLHEYRMGSLSLSAPKLSEILISLAKEIEGFIAQLFNIEENLDFKQKQTLKKNPIALFRKEFLLSKVKRQLHKPETLPPFSSLQHDLLKALAKHDINTGDLELDIATLWNSCLNNEEENTKTLETLAQWCAQALLTKEGRDISAKWESFRFPEKLDFLELIPTETREYHQANRQALNSEKWRQRDGFELTDQRMSEQAIQNEIHYCIYCHDHEGDLCSKGFPLSKKDPSQGFKKNPLNVTLTGCPLEERISEMHTLKRDGFTIAALAMVMLDNPMCPATGHRICNDCMKACIYQKQSPVNIPQIETRVLTDVLSLPWGVEIYDLLTKWNPLRQEQWVMKPYNGKKIMIAGQGPAGFTLAHHLLQEGCAVVGFDGLKIEPIDENKLKNPIYNYEEIKESLDHRLVAGFGGVAEYGITVRWDKNFLKLIYISLMRRPYFQVFGNIRFGGTVTIEDAWELGFDHFVIAVGAGLPKALPVENSMATGMRQANDFLMALQLTGAAKKKSLSALEIRMPILVIGGGLTGVDAATEAQAYYIRQIEKVAYRYHQLSGKYKKEEIYKQFDLASQEILEEFLSHAALIQAERKQAALEKREPNFIQFIHQWGGVSIVYRQKMSASPAYINNHEELYKALEEGIFYLDELSPSRVNLDEQGHCASMTFKTKEDKEITLAAKSILVATGASLNVAYSFEHAHALERKSMQYLSYEEKEGDLYAAHAVEHCKDPRFGPFTSYHAYRNQENKAHRVSFIGDTHPVFHGNVVKAIASAKYSYPKIMSHLTPFSNLNSHESEEDYAIFRKKIQEQFHAQIIDISFPHPNYMEIIIHAPQAIKHYKAGQFYRLQGFESQTHISHEAPWLFASKVDREKNHIYFSLRKTEAKQYFFDLFAIGDRVALMGPTGVRSKIPEFHEHVLIMANEKNLAHAYSYTQALKENGNKVVFIGYAETKKENYFSEKLNALCDKTIWHEDLIEAIKQYAEEKTSSIPFSEIDRIQIIGNSEQLKEIVALQKHYLKDKLPKKPSITASVHSHMQCMLKGVCAQCLQWQIDPETGKRTKAVFACSWQDQPLEMIDLDHLASRERQNSCQERLNEILISEMGSPDCAGDLIKVS